MCEAYCCSDDSIYTEFFPTLTSKSLSVELTWLTSAFLMQAFVGSHAEPERWYECVTYTNENMGNAVGRLFVQKYFDEGAKETVSKRCIILSYVHSD